MLILGDLGDAAVLSAAYEPKFYTVLLSKL